MNTAVPLVDVAPNTPAMNGWFCWPDPLPFVAILIVWSSPAVPPLDRAIPLPVTKESRSGGGIR